MHRASLLYLGINSIYRPHAAGWFSDSLRPQLGHQDGVEGSGLAGEDVEGKHQRRQGELH